MSYKKNSFVTITTIHIGGCTHRELMRQAEKRNVRCNDWAKEIFTHALHLPRRFSVEIVPIKLRIDLPKVSKELSLRAMINEGFENGLSLCPVSVGIEILLQSPLGFVNEAFLAMKPIICTCSSPNQTQDNILSILDKKHEYSQERWLGATPGNLDDFADGGYTYLFCRKNTELEKSGFAKL